LEDGLYDVCVMLENFEPACQKVRVEAGVAAELQIALPLYTGPRGIDVGTRPIPPAAPRRDLRGLWELTMTSPAGPVTIDATLVQIGDVITTEVKSPLGLVYLKGSFDNDVLTLNQDSSGGGGPRNMRIQVYPWRERLWGRLTVSERRTIVGHTWLWTRKPAASPKDAAPSAGITGDWHLQLSFERGDTNLWLVHFTQQATRVTGTVAVGEGLDDAEWTVTGSISDNDLTLTMGGSQTQYPVTFTGHLNSDGTLRGKMPQEGLTWIAKRVRD
jgi:hypothetical protein